MPRVPFIPQVGLQQAGSVGFSAGPRVVPFDSPTGQQMQQLGEVIAQTGGQVSRLGQTIQERVDRGAITSASALLQEEATREQQSYGKLLGLDAVSAREASLKRLADRRAKLESALSNDRQRLEFKLQADRTMLEHEMAVDSHYEKQSRTYEMQASAARAEGAIDAYVSSFLSGQNEAAAGHEETLESEVRHSAQIAGVAPEAIGGMVRDQKSRMHAGVVDKLLEDGGSSSMAAEYLAHAKKLGQISAKDDERLTDLVGRATVRDESKKVADFVTSKTLDPVQQRQILDTLSQQGLRTEVFDAALQRLRSDDDERYQQQQRGARESVQQATTWLQQNRATAKTWNDLPASMQQSLVATGRDRDVQLFMEQGGQWVTTMQGRSALSQIAANPARLRGTNFDEVANNLRPHLDDAGMQDLAEAWKDANEPGKRQKLPESMVNSMIRLHAIDSGWVPGDDTLTPEQSVQLERYELAIKTRLMGMDVSDPSVVKQALADEDKHAASSLGKLPIAAASMAQKNGMFWDTPYGRADANRLTPEVKQPILRRLSEKNAEKARLYQSLPPDQRPSLEVTEADIALEFARDQWMQRERNAAADEAGRAAMRERRVTPDGQVYFVDPGWWSGSRSLRRAQYEKGRQDYLNRNSK